MPSRRPGLIGSDWSDVDAIEQAVAMIEGLSSRRTTQIAVAGRVRPGDRVINDGRSIEVVRVRRAQGRKPAHGENLHLVGEDDVIKVNSIDAVRIHSRRD